MLEMSMARWYSVLIEHYRFALLDTTETEEKHRFAIQRWPKPT